MKLGSLHLTRWFFVAIAVAVGMLVISEAVPPLFFVGRLIVIILFLVTVVDAILLFLPKEPVSVLRVLKRRMDLGEPNEVTLTVRNNLVQPIHIAVYEGYPKEMQSREGAKTFTLFSRKSKQLVYRFTPVTRGIFTFGDVVVFMRSPLFLAQRRLTLAQQQEVEVYPSVSQMRRQELNVFNHKTRSGGIKRIRRIGTRNEFEQIKNYVQGDDIRTVNWKATSRKSEIMVNQYQDERSQPVFVLIDKSRPMQLSFEGMSMLDHAINATLTFSNIVLKKGDRVGMISFSDKIGTIIPAERKANQLKRIMDALFNQRTLFREANFELLYETVRQQAKTRSLLMLFTNFESEFAMRRALPMLRKLNQRHMLVVVFFQNNQLEEMSQKNPRSLKELVNVAVAEKMNGLKWAIARELRQNGIQTILAKPEELSVDTINKYLELKAKGSI